MILTNPYAFQGLKFANKTSLPTEINRYIVTDYSYHQPNQFLKVRHFESPAMTLKPVILYGLTPMEKDIPIFAHPYIHTPNNWIALDLRQVVTADPSTMTVKVRNDGEYAFTVLRFVMTGMWAIGETEAVYGLTLPHLVYGDWLAGNLTRKFGLNMGDQVKLSVLALIYYSTLFRNTFEPDDLDKLKIRLNKDIYTADLVDQVYEQAEKLDTIDDFCKACYKVTKNVRLQNLDFNVLVSVLSNNWFGLNSQEVTLLALEHPPTWVSLVFAGLTQRSFRNSFITKVTETRNKRGAGEEFIKEVTAIVRQYKED